MGQVSTFDSGGHAFPLEMWEFMHFAAWKPLMLMVFMYIPLVGCRHDQNQNGGGGVPCFYRVLPVKLVVES